MRKMYNFHDISNYFEQLVEVMGAKSNLNPDLQNINKTKFLNLF